MSESTAAMVLGKASTDDHGDLEKVFRRIDSNGDGKISPSEMDDLLRSVGSNASSDEIEQLMKEIDSNRDGFIDMKEFAEFIKDGDDEKQLMDAFKTYDLDGNGRISSKELHKVMKSMGIKCSFSECLKMIKSVDADGDGCVDFKEFKKMMNK